jgi:hypothetical protein
MKGSSDNRRPDDARRKRRPCRVTDHCRRAKRDPVAQICNLLYRRIAFGQALNGEGHGEYFITLEDSDVWIVFHACRLQICDTAECNSALPLRLCAFALNSGRVLTPGRQDAKTQENSSKLVLGSPSESHVACHPFPFLVRFPEASCCALQQSTVIPCYDLF